MQHRAKRPFMRRRVSYYQKLDLAGYRWQGYRRDRRKHFFARDLEWVALDDMEWRAPDFARFLELGRYSINWRTGRDYLRAKSQCVFPE